MKGISIYKLKEITTRLSLFLIYHKKQQKQPLKIKSGGGVVSTPPRPSAGIIMPAKVGLTTSGWSDWLNVQCRTEYPGKQIFQVILKITK